AYRRIHAGKLRMVECVVRLELQPERAPAVLTKRNSLFERQIEVVQAVPVEHILAYRAKAGGSAAGILDAVGFRIPVGCLLGWSKCTGVKNILHTRSRRAPTRARSKVNRSQVAFPPR